MSGVLGDLTEAQQEALDDLREEFQEETQPWGSVIWGTDLNETGIV
jgi:hypothetical protein